MRRIRAAWAYCWTWLAVVLMEHSQVLAVALFDRGMAPRHRAAAELPHGT
jgi:hypothetical protein